MKINDIKNIFPALICITFLNVNAQEKTNPTSQDEELGKVSRYRGYETALALSKEQDKPENVYSIIGMPRNKNNFLI